MSVTSVEELVRRAHAGNEAAWSELVESFRPQLVRLAKRLVEAQFPDRTAQDLAQDTIWKVVNARGQFNGWDTPENTLARLQSYLNVTLRNLADNVRRDNRTRKRTPPGPPVPTAPPDTSDSAVPQPADPTPVAPPELLLDLSTALDQLDEVSRALVVGVHFEKRSYKELAAEHGLSVSVVHSRLTDARKRLGTLLREWK